MFRECSVHTLIPIASCLKEKPVNHLIWPEGQPENPYVTTSSFKAFFVTLWMQTKQLADLKNTRRIRHATSEEPLKADEVEAILSKTGMYPPPGGWPKDEAPNPASDTIFNPEGITVPKDIHVRTHSVI